MAEATDTNSSLLAELREKDELIQNLRQALEDEQRRREELELALAQLANESGHEPPDNPPSAPTSTEPPVASPALDTGLKDSEEIAAPPDESDADKSTSLYDDDWPDAPLLGGAAQRGARENPERESQTGIPGIIIRDQSTGIYDDNWLRPRASLAIAKAFVGRNVTMTFYLPNIPGGAAKQVRIRPNFADSFNLEVPRGRPVSFACAIPALPKFNARITLDVEAEPKSGTDIRELGVLLVSAEIGP